MSVQFEYGEIHFLFTKLGVIVVNQEGIRKRKTNFHYDTHNKNILQQK